MSVLSGTHSFLILRLPFPAFALLLFTKYESSSLAAFIASMILFYVATINRLQGLSVENVSQYVFSDVRVPVIITDVDNKVVMCNSFTHEFLNVKMRKFINYCKESFVELTKKTTWPTWQKLQSSAILVIVATIILAALLSVIDFAFQSLMTAIYTL